jgi:polyphenol oxidase
MPFRSVRELNAFQFKNLSHTDLLQAVVSRQGGCSSYPWAALNTGLSVGDDHENVAENRSRIYKAFDINSDRVRDVWQVHSNRVIEVGDKLSDEAPIKADGMVTGTPGIVLMMRFADCVPILLFDPRRSAVGLVHAGWKGTIGRIAAAGVRMLEKTFGSNPADILAGIGPSICQNCYSVGDEVIEAVHTSLPDIARVVISKNHSQFQFDLWESNRRILLEAGVQNIETSAICTAENLGEWFSHRAENGTTGRFAAFIGLRK